jgi:hypothetical protein
MKLLEDLTKRRYYIAVAESDGFETQCLSLNYLFTHRDNDYEYVYAIQEMADELLDLKIGESIYFKPNRDNELAKGIIIRKS